MRVARTPETNERVEAVNASKGLAYHCPRCSEAVIFAKGNVRRPYFRHRPDSACAYGQGETWQHESAKLAILEGLRSRGLVAAPEVEVLTIEGDRRADVLMWAPQARENAEASELRCAFEAQHTAIPYENLMARTSAYMAARVPVIWMPVVDIAKFKTMAFDGQSKIVLIREFCAPAWMVDMDEMQGHNWMYIPQHQSCWRAWLLPNWRWKNPSERYDSDGTVQSAGGFWYPSKRAWDLFLEGPFSFGELRVIRRSYTGNQQIPSGDDWRALVHLLAPGEDRPAGSPVEQRRKPHVYDGRDTGYFSYEEWIHDNKGWRRANFEPIDDLPRP